eukprot:746620-Prymnesium_polylepis.1
MAPRTLSPFCFATGRATTRTAYRQLEKERKKEGREGSDSEGNQTAFSPVQEALNIEKQKSYQDRKSETQAFFDGALRTAT